MADCEETESAIRKIPRCQAQCAENFVTPARKIIEAEVDRVNNMINFELDECIQTARDTVYADSFKEGTFYCIFGNFQSRALSKISFG